MALLEADVHYKVVKDFINAVQDRAIGQEVLASLTPGQQVIKIVNEELTRIMGETFTGLRFSGGKPAVIMLVGLQGSGKTTTAGKLARLLSKDHRKPYLVPLDIRWEAGAPAPPQPAGFDFFDNSAAVHLGQAAPQTLEPAMGAIRVEVERVGFAAAFGG